MVKLKSFLVGVMFCAGLEAFCQSTGPSPEELELGTYASGVVVMGQNIMSVPSSYLCSNLFTLEINVLKAAPLAKKLGYTSKLGETLAIIKGLSQFCETDTLVGLVQELDADTKEYFVGITPKSFENNEEAKSSVEVIVLFGLDIREKLTEG